LPSFRPSIVSLVLLLAAACGGAAPSSTDAAADAVSDAATVSDAALESAPDTTSDVAPDAGLDVMPGAGSDAPAEARSDASSKAPPDAPSEAASAAACALLDATCLAPFFAAADTCFAPAGPCTRSQSGDTTTYCWQNGAQYCVASNGSVTWSAGGAPCAHGSQDATMFSVILDVTPAAPLYYFAFDTGETACEGTPGRSTTDPSVATCPSFQALLAPDVSACAPGTCN
jgi:hypothetical protein